MACRREASALSLYNTEQETLIKAGATTKPNNVHMTRRLANGATQIPDILAIVDAYGGPR